MGLKKITNSPTGRIALMLILMCTIGLGSCGALLWWFIWQPQASSSAIEEHVKGLATNWVVSDVVVGKEEAPLDGLPSSTLSYRDVSNSVDGSSDINGAIMFPLNALGTTTLDSLVNVSTYYAKESTGVSDHGDYNLKFYSDQLNDYETDEGYFSAARQFAMIYKSSVTKLDYTSTPTPNGGRIVDIDVQSSVSFSKAAGANGKNIWEGLLRGVEETSDFEAGQVINLKLTDASGLVSLSTVLSSSEDVATAVAIPEGMWDTFSNLLEGSSFEFLKAQKLSYQVEDTPQASTMTVTVDASVKDISDLKSKIWKTGIDTTPQTLIPWSYITYLVTPEDPSPFLTSYSTSRNW